MDQAFAVFGLVGLVLVDVLLAAGAVLAWRRVHVGGTSLQRKKEIDNAPLITSISDILEGPHG